MVWGGGEGRGTGEQDKACKALNPPRLKLRLRGLLSGVKTGLEDFPQVRRFSSASECADFRFETKVPTAHQFW